MKHTKISEDNMKINCIEILINDEELGCQLTFSDKKELGEDSENMTVQELIDSLGKYLLIQRSYPEDEFESDYIHFETHDKKCSGELIDYEMFLSKERFELNLLNEKIEVLINPTQKEYSELKKILPILTNNSGKITVSD
ncbi:hypothetical protein [Alkalitalea saponilacus]|uniref:Immunity protein 10 n=1 Tax=Alkalitalea saponilacus TaxID=889453 RepID=A0A1T5HU24_9BACT|nr:hypothetical protein [Alkalitalea saponilacus]ASB50486.1 hypothetical protein CDL62_15685 [Alkalitalea saponilacus]SKC24177.1 hypothetical protein SAMN03080601_03470 [Alkalitalea saponilacus]